MNDFSLIEYLDVKHLKVKDRVLQRMDDQIDEWATAGDQRHIFLQCYRTMTGNMLDQVHQGFFHDAIWVEKLLNQFANYYFNALTCYECHDATPPVWQEVHRRTSGGGLHPMQYLLIGVNAHINYDLVLAVNDMLKDEWPRLDEHARQLRKEDHWKVNEVIANTIDQVQDEVIEPGHPLMQVIDVAFGRLDEYLLSRLISSWRAEVWENAMRMLESSSDHDREEIRIQLEAEVVRKGNLICLKT